MPDGAQTRWRSSSKRWRTSACSLGCHARAQAASRHHRRLPRHRRAQLRADDARQRTGPRDAPCSSAITTTSSCSSSARTLFARPAGTKKWMTKDIMATSRRRCPARPSSCSHPPDIELHHEDAHSDPRIVALSKQLADISKRHSWGFWDFCQAMGGDLSMMRFAKAGLALERSLVHLTHDWRSHHGEPLCAHALFEESRDELLPRRLTPRRGAKEEIACARRALMARPPHSRRRPRAVRSRRAAAPWRDRAARGPEERSRNLSRASARASHAAGEARSRFAHPVVHQASLMLQQVSP